MPTRPEMADEASPGYHAGAARGASQRQIGERKAVVEGLAPGDWVRNPLAPEWGLGQVQSVIGDRVTANFENAGKRLINAAVVSLTRVESPVPRSESWSD